jgi:hypothetical protein
MKPWIKIYLLPLIGISCLVYIILFNTEQKIIAIDYSYFTQEGVSRTKQRIYTIEEYDNLRNALKNEILEIELLESSENIVFNKPSYQYHSYQIIYYLSFFVLACIVFIIIRYK